VLSVASMQYTHGGAHIFSSCLHDRCCIFVYIRLLSCCNLSWQNISCLAGALYTTVVSDVMPSITLPLVPKPG
jgi:hypothetical protein